MVHWTISSDERRELGRAATASRSARPPVHPQNPPRLSGHCLCYSGRNIRIVLDFLQLLARGGGFALLVPHRSVMTVHRQEFGMAAALDDAAVIQDQYLVGVDHGGKPVGDHQGGAAA